MLWYNRHGGSDLAGWQAYSGQDANSVESWFSLNPLDPPLSTIFYNPTGSPINIDLGGTQYFDLDQTSVLGSFILQPFTSRILIDDGPAPLDLLSLHPSMKGLDEAEDFTLTLKGTGFTPNSIVRWNGADRPTAFVSSAILTATISVTDVNNLGEIRVLRGREFSL